MSDETNKSFQEIVRGVELDDSLIRVYQTVEDLAFRHSVEEAIDAPLIYAAAHRYANEYDRLLALAEVNDYDSNLKLVMQEMKIRYKLSEAEIVQALFICKGQINQLRALAKKHQQPDDHADTPEYPET